MEYQSIGKEKAIKLYDSKWWEGLTPREAPTIQQILELIPAHKRIVIEI